MATRLILATQLLATLLLATLLLATLLLAAMACGDENSASVDGGTDALAGQVDAFPIFQVVDAPLDVPAAPGDAATPPMCRGLGGTCQGNADCCSELFCAANTCVAPPMCRSLASPCEATQDCCLPFVCSANRCVPAPQCRIENQTCEGPRECCGGFMCQGGLCKPSGPACGDGMCTGGETPGSCCLDCTCPEGALCGLRTQGCVQTNATLKVTLTDSCDDEKGFGYRVFDRTNLVVWPPVLTSLFVIPAGQSRFTEVPCVRGAQICYGAETDPSDGRAWGLGLAANKTCADCCAICGDSAEASFTLACD
jgi:hypothetical protein